MSTSSMFVLFAIVASHALNAVAISAGLKASSNQTLASSLASGASLAVAESRPNRDGEDGEDEGSQADEAASSDEDEDDEARLVRPNAGQGVDRVKFGMVAKNFYGTDLKKMRFKMDVVMSLRWRDERVVDMIPEGLDKLVMSTRQAKKNIWMPDIVVTNRDIDMYEIVSSSVSIFRSGDVHRVERAMVRILEKFNNLNDYPFDNQHLQVIIASSKYMSNEVVLTPSLDPDVSGVDEKIWGNYYLQSWETEAYETSDGLLKKSRGRMNIEVKRHLEKYKQDHLVPSFIAIVISWAVFYFPFAGPFITPRLALSILALLTFTNLIIKSSKALPGAAPFNWNDLFNQQIQILMFATIIINVFTEIVYHMFDMKDIGKRVNNEAKIVSPSLGLINIVAILSAGYYKWLSLAHTTLLTQVLVVLFLGTYIGQIVYIVRGEFKARKAKEAAGSPA